jgi:hypothetical protein
MDNINDIIASLTPDDIASLKATAESIFGSQNQSGSPPKGPAPNTSDSTNEMPGGMDIGSMVSPEMFAKMAQIMSAMNNDGGRRCKLIEALKPNLSEGRQKKADEAMQILKLLEILPMINKLTDRDD